MRYDKDRVEYLLRQDKSTDVVEELIVLNYGLMQKQLNKFGMYNDPDALSYAYESLYRAIITYNLEDNHKFSTYATVCIYNRLGSYVRSLKTQIVVNTTSYDNPIDEAGKTMLDVLESVHTADGSLLSECGVSVIYETILDCMKSMKNPLHYQIVELWMDSGFKATHTFIADELECTQSYVSQTLKIFKNTLKKKLGES